MNLPAINDIKRIINDSPDRVKAIREIAAELKNLEPKLTGDWSGYQAIIEDETESENQYRDAKNEKFAEQKEHLIQAQECEKQAVMFQKLMHQSQDRRRTYKVRMNQERLAFNALKEFVKSEEDKIKKPFDANQVFKQYGLTV